jgi:hypothetical protein
VRNDKIFKFASIKDGRDFITAINRRYIPFNNSFLLYEVVSSLYLRGTNPNFAAPRNTLRNHFEKVNDRANRL